MNLVPHCKRGEINENFFSPTQMDLDVPLMDRSRRDANAYLTRLLKDTRLKIHTFHLTFWRSGVVSMAIGYLTIRLTPCPKKLNKHQRQAQWESMAWRMSMPMSLNVATLSGFLVMWNMLPFPVIQHAQRCFTLTLIGPQINTPSNTCLPIHLCI